MILGLFTTLKYIISKKGQKLLDLKYFKFILSMLPSEVLPIFALIFYNLYPFFLSSIMIDAKNFREHVIVSIVSLWMLVLVLWLILFAKPHILSYSYIWEIDKTHTFSYFWSNMLLNLYLSLLFAFEYFSNSSISFGIAVSFQIVLILI